MFIERVDGKIIFNGNSGNENTGQGQIDAILFDRYGKLRSALPQFLRHLDIGQACQDVQNFIFFTFLFYSLEKLKHHNPACPDGVFLKERFKTFSTS